MDKTAEVAVQPVDANEVLAVLRFARKRGVPVTVRGAGTANYGRCVPLEGGIVLDLSLMDRLEEITADGVAVCLPGLRLGTLETEARKLGWELRMYPSTLVKASVGGFLGGGSGGIGSVAHGGLRDFDTVRAFEVATMEDEPRLVLHEGPAVHEILHAWGTNGVLTRIWFALTPAVEWTQVTVAFDSYDDAFDFTASIATGAGWTKRLATVFEWPIPSFFTPVKTLVREGKSLALIMIATTQADERNFSYFTWKQVDALSRDRTLLILPTAAIEQHGHHLPLATDTLINNLLLGKALAQMPAELQIYALPPVCYGKSNEHIGFPGTISVSAATFMAVVRDVGASVAAAGFQKLVLYNTHGGNTSLVDVLARDLRAEFGLRTFSLFGSGGAPHEGVSVQECTYGFHAGEVETACLLHATPELVHPAEYTTNYIARVDEPELLKPEGSSANFAWLTKDIAPSGVMGDPTDATAENGERWSNAAAARIAEVLAAMYNFEPRHGA